MAFVKWMTAATTATTTVMMAGSALALSCVQPSIEGSFQTWSDSPERYYIISGTLTPARPLPPIPSASDASRGPVDTSNLRGVYQIQGEVVYAQQTVPINHYIWVRVGCAGPWCGGFPSAGTSGVMALKQLPDQTLELHSGACPGDIFPDDSGTVKARVQQCMTTGCVAPSR